MTRDVHTLHDAGVIIRPRVELGHSLADEAYQPIEYERYTFHWSHVIKFAIGMVLVYLLIVAWIVIGTAAS